MVLFKLVLGEVLELHMHLVGRWACGPVLSQISCLKPGVGQNIV